MQRWVWIGVIAWALAGCALFKDEAEKRKNWTVEQFYEEAKNELDSGNWETAVKLLEQLESRFPYGRYAQQAQLDLAYANYKRGEHALAISAADRFLKLHPNHQVADYAIYLKGLANFNDDPGIFGTLADVDLAERDGKAARESFDTFKELITRFPESRYAEDARLRMGYLVNAMGRLELITARYYLRRGAPLAAANRAQIVVERYPQTPSAQEALRIMVESYDKMGMTTLRDDARRVYEKNYPQAQAPAVGGKPWWKFW